MIALLPGNESDDTYYSHGGLTYGGFILSYHATATVVLEAFYLLCRYLKGTAGVGRIVYRPFHLFIIIIRRKRICMPFFG